MKDFLRSAFSLFKTTFRKWWAHDPFQEGAALAYSAIFALPGLLVLLITLAGYFMGQDVVSGRLNTEIASAMGKTTADQVQEMVTFASRSRGSVLATIIGGIVILMGSIGVFIQLQKTFNEIWEVKAEKKKSSIKTFLMSRLFSFGLILSIAFLLIISLVISSVLSAMSHWIESHWSESLLVIVKIINFLISLCIISVLFALMFKFLPDAKIKWKSVWTGAIVTSLLFTAGKTALGLYFGKANPGSGYGAAGSIILILLWTSYSSAILFFGAEFTKVNADAHNEKTTPSEHAVSSSSKV